METSTAANVAPARVVDAGHGVAWWSDAWAMFMKNAGMWVVLGLILIIITIVLGVLPVVGGIALALLWPVFMGGWLLAAQKQEAGSTIEPGDLFLGFKQHLNPLLVLGAFSVAGSLVMMLVMFAAGMGAVAGAGMGAAMQSSAGVMAAAGMGLMGFLISLLIMVPLSMALWFAPALVVSRGMPPVEAVKSSFSACLRNVLPFLIFGVLGLVASVIASIPMGLGWLLLLPLVMLTLHTSYRDVFGAA